MIYGFLLQENCKVENRDRGCPARTCLFRLFLLFDLQKQEFFLDTHSMQAGSLRSQELHNSLGVLLPLGVLLEIFATEPFPGGRSRIAIPGRLVVAVVAVAAVS